mgnify:CR=1 FL=1
MNGFEWTAFGVGGVVGFYVLARFVFHAYFQAKRDFITKLEKDPE